jgi:hypothetical protein
MTRSPRQEKFDIRSRFRGNDDLAPTSLLTMLDRLTIGHLEAAAVERRQRVPVKALEMDVVRRLFDELGERDADGSAILGGCKVKLSNGYVSCLWKGGQTNRELEESALRMQRETGCLIADVSGYRVIAAGELARSNGPLNTASAMRRATGR